MRWPFSRSKAIVLLYHRIASVTPDPWSLCVTPEHFEEHLQVLQHYHRIRLDQFVPGERSLNGPAVAVTFDDGYADNFHNASPLLQRYEVPATFFIATGAIDSRREFWWDELERIVCQSDNGSYEDALKRYLRLYEQLQPLSHDARSRLIDNMCCGQVRGARRTHRVLTSAELVDLASSSLFEIGAHTVTHPVLAAQSAQDQHWEVHASKLWLERLLGRAITSISYPYGGRGHYNQATLAAVAQAGYQRALTTVPATVCTQSAFWNS